MIFIHYKDFKTLIITGFSALAGQIQHMAAQKVGFTTPRPGRYGPPDLFVKLSYIGIYISELSLERAS